MNSKTCQKDHAARSSRLHPRFAEVVQHTKISKCNLSYNQTERESPYNHLNKFKKSAHVMNISIMKIVPDRLSI